MKWLGCVTDFDQAPLLGSQIHSEDKKGVGPARVPRRVARFYTRKAVNMSKEVSLAGGYRAI